MLRDQWPIFHGDQEWHAQKARPYSDPLLLTVYGNCQMFALAFSDLVSEGRALCVLVSYLCDQVKRGWVLL